MHLKDIINRKPVPDPWEEGDAIPWSDPAMSRRILAEHLDPSHDAASRRVEFIEQHVRWIHGVLLGGSATRVLDICCGPGLYTQRLAGLGHDCTGIDYSPAAIEYAQNAARESSSSCVYVKADIRDADLGAGYGLVMMIFGEFNTLPREAAVDLLVRIRQALAPGGRLLLEVHRHDALHRMGSESSIWHTESRGFFHDGPYLCLEESFWNIQRSATTIRYFVIDGGTSEVHRYAQSFQAYTDAEYTAVLEDAGFSDLAFYPSLAGAQDMYLGDFMAISARGPGRP